MYSLLGFGLLPGRWKMPRREVPALRVLGREKNILTKRPKDALFIDEIREACRKVGKRLSVVFMVRHPQSVVTSMHCNVPDDFFIGLDSSYMIHRNSRPTQSDSGLKEWVKAWREHKDDADLQVVRFEDLVTKPDAVQEQLVTAFQLQMCQPFSDWNENSCSVHEIDYAMNGVRKIDPANASTDRSHWRRQEQTNIPGFKEACKEMGYDLA